MIKFGKVFLGVNILMASSVYAITCNLALNPASTAAACKNTPASIDWLSADGSNKAPATYTYGTETITLSKTQKGEGTWKSANCAGTYSCEMKP